MQKLIDRYRTNPTTANARAVLAYAHKHPFSTLMVNAAGAQLLRTLGV
jgi:hypothetical protein